MTTDARCKACNQPILWAVTKTGSRMPLDPEPNPKGNVIVVARAGNGTIYVEVLNATQRDVTGGEKWMPHFESCPKWDAYLHDRAARTDRLKARDKRRRGQVREPRNYPKARHDDPVTSVKAAAANGHAADKREELIVTAFLRFGPMTDDELCATMADAYPPTVKSARSRLTLAGALVWSGEERPSVRGRAMRVWRLTGR